MDACRKARAVEHMIVDALIEAEPALRLTERTEDAREFVKLDDTVLKVCLALGISMAANHTVLNAKACIASYVCSGNFPCQGVLSAPAALLLQIAFCCTAVQQCTCSVN